MVATVRERGWLGPFLSNWWLLKVAEMVVTKA